MIHLLSDKIKQAAIAITQNIWKTAFGVFSAALLIIMVKLSQLYGMTWDEWMDSNNAMLALRNILSGGFDMAFMNFWHGYLYPQVFYTFVGATFGFFFDHIQNIAHEGLHKETLIIPFFKYSHMINSICGYIAILITGFFAKKMAGWRAGFLALVFIALSPRFFGNSMNNPKDIPFAVTYILSLFCMASFLENLPRVSKKDFFLTSISIGLCIGSRLGGIILTSYLIFLSFITLLFLTPVRPAIKEWFRIAFILLGITLVSLAVGFIFWPFGRTHTPIETFRAIMELTKFEFWDNGVLFEGIITKASHLPWYYLSKWILISSPLFFSVGLVLWGSFLRLKSFFTNRSLLLLTLAGFFPILFIIVRHSIVYDGWRHLLFVYPPLVVLCALGWEKMLQADSNKIKASFMILFLVLFCLEPLSWMARNPTYAHVYFNPLVGGLKKAFINYESDYWGTCLEESAEWLADHHIQNHAEFPFALVIADGQLMQTYPYLKRKLGPMYRPFGYPQDFMQTNPYMYVGAGAGMMLPKDLPWNYGIFMSRGRNSENLQRNWPPAGTIFTAKADGVPLCAVVKNDFFYESLARERARQAAQQSAS